MSSTEVKDMLQAPEGTYSNFSLVECSNQGKLENPGTGSVVWVCRYNSEYSLRVVARVGQNESTVHTYYAFTINQQDIVTGLIGNKFDYTQDDKYIPLESPPTLGEVLEEIRKAQFIVGY